MVKFVQILLYVIVQLPFRIYFSYENRGLEKIPDGHFILAANHTSKIDPFLLGLLPFRTFNKISPIFFLTTDNYYNKWYLKPWMKMMGAYPIKDKCWTWQEYLGSTVEKIRYQHNVMIFPEGRINESEAFSVRAKPGIGYLVVSTKARVFPMKIQWQGKNQWGQNKVKVSLGKIMKFNYVPNTTDSYRKISDQILKTIYKL